MSVPCLFAIEFVPCLFAIEFGVLEFWLCRSVLKHSINKRNQSQGLPIDISVQLQACFCSYRVAEGRPRGGCFPAL